MQNHLQLLCMLFLSPVFLTLFVGMLLCRVTTKNRLEYNPFFFQEKNAEDVLGGLMTVLDI